MPGEDQTTSRRRLPTRRVGVDAAGNIVVPASLAADLGVSGPDDLVWERTEDSIRLIGDRLRKIYVEGTTICNLSCPMCIRQTWDESPGHMPIERYQRLLDGLPAARPGALTLALSGFGEPMMHPAFLDMLRLARGRDLRVEITSNGTFLDAAMAQELVAVGVAQVAVSVDGGSEAANSAMRGTSLGPILQGLVALREARRRGRAPMRIGLACVATRQNVSTLPALVRLVGEMRLDFLSISSLLPHTAVMADDILWERTAAETNYPPKAWRPQLILGRLDLNETTRPLWDAVGSQGPVMPPPAFDGAEWFNRCRFAHEGMLAVAWDGRVSPCLSLLHTHAEHVFGQARTICSYTVGSIDDRSLADIWRDPAFVAFRRRVQAFDFSPCFSCGPCPLTDTNEGDCYGNPFPTCGLCLWAQGIVLCP